MCGSSHPHRRQLDPSTSSIDEFEAVPHLVGWIYVFDGGSPTARHNQLLRTSATAGLRGVGTVTPQSRGQ